MSRVVHDDSRKPLGDHADITARTGRVFKSVVAILPRTRDDDIGTAPQCRAKHCGHRREVHVCCDHNVGSSLRTHKRAGAICRRQENRHAAHSFSCKLRWRIAQIEAFDRQHLPLAGETHVAALELPSARHQLVGVREWNDGARTVGERRCDRRGCSQHVDDGDDTSRRISARKFTRRQIYI